MSKVEEIDLKLYKCSVCKMKRSNVQELSDGSFICYSCCINTMLKLMSDTTKKSFMNRHYVLEKEIDVISYTKGP